jgi:hypothetical protein
MKKHHWHVFRHEKLFEKHPQPYYQTRSKVPKQSSLAPSKKTRRVICKFKQLQSRPNAALFSELEVMFVLYLKSIFKNI